MILNPNILIVSVFEKGEDQDLNIYTHNKTMRFLRSKNIPCLEIEGTNNGIKELNILVEGFENRDAVEIISRTFKQECYLESYGDRATFLVFPDGTKQNIGILTAVSKEEALKQNSWSYNKTMDQYYVAM